MSPLDVFGKEFSHDRDYEVGPAADPEQVLLWDGSGGTANGVDFTGTRPNYEPDDQVDAIANTRDTFFFDLMHDRAHLIFTHDDEITGYGPAGGFGPVTLPMSAPVFLSNGYAIGGTGEISVEEATAFGGAGIQMPWAKRDEIDRMPLPRDVDGIEVWGREPREVIEDPDMMFPGDTDKYSLESDAFSGVSVWNGDGTPYIPKPMIDFVVTSLLSGMPGMVPPGAFDPFSNLEGQQAINLDALMVFDSVGDPRHFDDQPGFGPNGDGIFDQNGERVEVDNEVFDTILFSIKQIINPADPDGYFATGSEIFWLDGSGAFGFLDHGGHLWDHAHALSALSIVGEDGEQFRAVIDINGIEAIGEAQFTPPTGLPGDFNGDGTVDAADYTVFRDNLGGFETAFAPLTGSGNGTVGAEDYSLWRSNFGATSGSPLLASPGAVPEPSTAALLGLPVVGIAVWRVLRKK
jgi:hypothetical protein